jgi:hypothetical protein
LIEPSLSGYEGRLIKTTGDGALVEFASPLAALRCAVEIQNHVASGGSSLRLRVGLNLGDVIVGQDGDLYGDGINTAVRLEGIANPGGILISEKVYSKVEGKLDVGGACFREAASRPQKCQANSAQETIEFYLKARLNLSEGDFGSLRVGVRTDGYRHIFSNLWRHKLVNGIRSQTVIVKVETRKHWRAFHRLPYQIYKNDRNWVPPLLLERKLHFNAAHNPFFQHAEASFWLAFKDNEPVGRISAQIDRLYLEKHREQTGHFGFLEAVDDPSVFRMLLASAEDWLQKNGMSQIAGPVSFSMWDQPGLLIDGFDTPPCVMMNHSLPYFRDHVEAAGYMPIQDLIAYDYSNDIPLPRFAKRILERAGQDTEITLRPIHKDKKRFKSEVAILLDIINDAWAENWGFVPMTRKEAEQLASLFQFLLRPDDVAIAEYRGIPVAFAVIIPNVNDAISDLRGKLIPWGWVKLLWRLKVSGTKSARMPMMGVRKALQNSPLGAALALSVIGSTRSFQLMRGTQRCELSWVLDQNHRTKHVIEMAGARPYKRYRIYSKHLAA